MAPKRPPQRANARRSRGTGPDSEQVFEDLAQDIDIAELQERVNKLSSTVVGLAGLSAMDNLMVNGFEALLDALKPLQDITVKRELLSPEQNARLTALRASLQQPVWSSAGQLSFDWDHYSVGFILARVPDPLVPQPTTGRPRGRS